MRLLRRWITVYHQCGDHMVFAMFPYRTSRDSPDTSPHDYIYQHIRPRECFFRDALDLELVAVEVGE